MRADTVLDCVAIVGASGAVGQELLAVLEQRRFPLRSLRLLASPRSAGRTVRFRERTYTLETLRGDSLRGVQLALFSAGAAVSREFAPAAASSGTLVVDNSSAFRADPDVPLVVPEVNAGALQRHAGIIANPNCSTIIMVVPLKPLHSRWGVKRVIASTYQAVSGAGQKGISELEQQVADLAAGREPRVALFPKQIAYNAIPRIPQRGGLCDGGYLEEEVKMIRETKKIFGDDSIQVTATCVRVPVIRCHSESINVELAEPFRVEEIREALAAAEGVTVQDDVANDVYPVPLEVSNQDDVFVGRIRVDNTNPQALNLWICGDQIRKGAALNAVQIAEDLVKMGMLAVKA